MIKQKRRILLLALYLLKRYGVPQPHKQRVLSFIRSRDLMRILPEDERIRQAGEEAWKHDLSWMRNSLRGEGLLRMPERGIWEITEAGELDVEAWAQRVKQATERRPDWANRFEIQADSETGFDVGFRFLTEQAVRWGLKISEQSAS